MYPAPVLHRVTEEEFLGLPESTERVELLDGEVIVAPSPLGAHQYTLGELFVQVRGWTRAHPPARVVLAPFDVRFGPDRILQPDLSLFVAGPPPDDEVPSRVIPEVVAEVLSQRRSYDRLTKRAIYLDAGVREYWIVDPENRVVEVVTRHSSRVVHDLLRSDSAPGLVLAIPELFGA